MRVGFDTKDLLSGGHRAGAYFLELLPELLASAEEDDELWVFRSEEGETEPLAWLLRDQKLHQLNAPFRGRRSSGLWRSLSFPAVERLVSPPGKGRMAALDACHSIHPPLMPSRASRKILTLHQFEDDANGKLPAALRRSLQTADAVITTGASLERELEIRVKRALSRHAAAISAKTWVIHPGIHDRYRQPPKPTQIEALCEPYPFLNEPYLLAAGGASDVERSVPFLADACGAAAAADSTLPPLVVLAEQEQAESIVNLLAGKGLDGRLLMVHQLTIETLPALYRGAEFLLYPATDFAFGLAVVEAAASGVPSITGPNCGALEILADSALVPKAPDLEAWSQAILDLHHDPARRRELGQRCRDLVEPLDWRRTAEAHWGFYRGAT